MAKFKLNEWMNEARGSVNKESIPRVRDTGQDVFFSKNQHGLILGKKPRPHKQSSEKQRKQRNRYKNCDCIYKNLTDAQKEVFRAMQVLGYTECTADMRFYNCFMKHCLKRKLRNYLENFLKSKITLELIDNNKYSATFKATYQNADEKHGNKRYFWVFGEWVEIDVDRFYLKFGETRVIVTNGTDEVELLKFLQPNKNEIIFTIQHDDVKRELGDITGYWVYLEHEGLTSNTIYTKITTAVITITYRLPSIWTGKITVFEDSTNVFIRTTQYRDWLNEHFGANLEQYGYYIMYATDVQPPIQINGEDHYAIEYRKDNTEFQLMIYDYEYPYDLLDATDSDGNWQKYILNKHKLPPTAEFDIRVEQANGDYIEYLRGSWTKYY